MADWAQLGGAIAGGSLLPSAFRIARGWLSGSSTAEARKINAEASRIEWQTMRDEIDRLGIEVRELRALECENRKLRGKVRKLEVRVSGLEAILHIGPITPEMQAALDELDRKTAGESK